MENMTGKFKKLRIGTALLLAMLMVALLPLQVTSEASEPEKNPEAVKVSEQKIEPQILAELVEKRSEYTKYFLLDDDTRMAVQYENPVHFQDKDGKWIEYDNRFEQVDAVSEIGLATETETLAVTENASAATEAAPNNNAVVLSASDDSQEFVNKESNIDVRFSNKAKLNNMVKLKADGCQISWGYTNTSKSRVEFIQNNEELEGNDKFLTLKNTVQEALYQDVYENVDLQYFITTQGIKENIILKNKDAQTSFTAQYKAKGITAVQEDKKTISLQNKNGEIIYTLYAPYMIDADGNSSDSVTITLKNQTGDKFTVEINVDKGWLSQWERTFPVTVDPELSIGVAAGSTTTAFTSSAKPSTATKQQTYFYVGNQGTTYGTCKGLIKLNQLPELGIGDRIVEAKLNLVSLGYSGTNIIINAHDVNSIWENSTAKEDNIVYDSNILDYAVFKGADSYKLSLDITKSVKAWYGGSLSNNGILLETPTSNSYVHFSGYAYYHPADKPVFAITYKNFVGTEPDLTYHTHQIGRYGEANISDYLGSLILKQNIFEGTGSRMPVTITASYNSILSNEEFSNGLSIGCGWQFSFNQCILNAGDALKSAGYDYIYIDEDGTRHYFKLKEDLETEWISDDQLDLKLTKDNLYLYITDTSGIINKYQLTSNGGKILSKTDQYNNCIEYLYDESNNIKTITDGAGRTYSILYMESQDSNKKRISQISAPDGKTVAFTYDSVGLEKLSSVLYKDEELNIFESLVLSYNQATNKIKRIVLADHSELRYEFNQAGQISKITEYGTNYLKGNSLSISYSNSNTTTFTDQKTRSVTYTFDNLGNTVSVLNPNGYIMNQTESGSPEAGAESYTKNYIISSNNPNSFYFPAYYGTINGELSGGTVSYDNSTDKINDERTQYFGQRSIKIENIGLSQFYTMAKQDISAAELPGMSLTFSSYVKTSNVVASKSEVSGAMLKLKFLSSDGTVILEKNSPSIYGNNQWQRISVSVIAPSTTAKIEVYCGLYDAQGTAWFDCLQLEEGDCMNNYNAISNSDFTENNSWQGSYTLIGNASKQNRLVQDVYVNQSNIGFNVSGEVAAQSVPLRDNRKFGIALIITYADASNSVEEHYQEFNDLTDMNQSVCMYVKPEKCDTIIKKVSFTFVFDYNIGVMTPLNAMLNFEYGVYSDDLTDNTSMILSEEEEFVSSTEPYCGKKYTYDSFGNVLDFRLGTIIPSESGETILDSSKSYIVTSNSYDSTGNYIISESDSRGNKINYSINSNNGQINFMTDAKNNKTLFTYNADGNLASITSGNTSNIYQYDYDKLTKISRNNFNCNFSYDGFGNLASSSINSNRLILNTYSVNNGNLESSIYGNGDEINFLYDQYDRLVQISNKLGVISKYSYNKKSLITKEIDVLSGLTTDYEYNLEGTCLRKMTYSNDLSTMYIENKITDGNDSSTKIMVIDGKERSINTTIDQNGNYIVGNDGWDYSVINDSLERKIQEKTLINKNGDFFTTNYEYTEGAGENKTTELVKKVIQRFRNNIISEYLYLYDANGNITSVSENGNEIYCYSYDSYNQLSSFTDKIQNLYYHISYDNAGNFESVNVQRWNPIYGYPEGNPNANVYYYNNNWKDMLTKFNNNNITYDEIGNPITYRNNMIMDWENGRQLKRISQDGNSTTFTYNAHGIRTQKDCNGIVTKYYYDENNKLISQITGDRKLIFYYNTDGSVNSVLDNDTRYYYVKNLQGDIIKLLKEDGTVAANYSYDMFGKMLSITSKEGKEIIDKSDIALLNPLRYREYVYDNESGLYYLLSRYYDPVTGRFINADEYCDTESGVLGTNMFSYCMNDPVNFYDAAGDRRKPAIKLPAQILRQSKVSGKIYVIYYTYNKNDGAFTKEVKNSAYFDYNSKNTIKKPVQSWKQFRDAWKNMPNNMDYVFLYLHGEKGTLEFFDGTISYKSKFNFYDLKKVKVKNAIYLFSCHGAQGGAKSVAAMFAAKSPNTNVYACEGGVSFRWENGRVYARQATSSQGPWKRFRFTSYRSNLAIGTIY